MEKSDQSNRCAERPHTPQLSCEIGADGSTNKRILAPSYQRSSSSEVEDIETNGEAELQGVAQPPFIATVKTDKSIPNLSRSDSIALKEASRFVWILSRKDFRLQNFQERPTADGTVWSGRLRSRPAPEDALPKKLFNAQRKPVERPQGVVKRRSRKSAKISQQLLFQ